jgi:hypothetical protein
VTLRPPRRRERGTFELRVRVEDHRGAPAPRTTVRLVGAEGFHATATVGRDGTLRLRRLPGILAGAVLTVWPAGGDPAHAKREQGAAIASAVVRLRSPVVVSTGAPPARRRRTRRNPSTVVSGRVVDRDGRPVAGATVFALPAKGAAAPRPPEAGRASGPRSCTTHRHGGFRMAGLRTGRRRLVADFHGIFALGVLLNPAPSADVRAVRGRETGGVVLRLPFSIADVGSVEFVVRDARGRPRRGARAWCASGFDAPGWFSNVGTTASDGTTHLLALAGRRAVHVFPGDGYAAADAVVEVRGGRAARVTVGTPFLGQPPRCGSPGGA